MMEKGKIIKNGNVNLENLVVISSGTTSFKNLKLLNSNEVKEEFDEKWALNKAVEAAKNSNCKSQRGVVLWHRETGLYSSGYNAPPLPFVCDGSDKCRTNCSKTAVHAEQLALMEALNWFDFNRLYECEMIHVKIVDGLPVVSEKPSCWQCSKLILAAGLKSMWLYQKEGFVEYSAYDFHRITLENCDLM